jgi:hypothetical protein
MCGRHRRQEGGGAAGRVGQWADVECYWYATGNTVKKLNAQHRMQVTTDKKDTSTTER